MPQPPVTSTIDPAAGQIKEPRTCPECKGRRTVVSRWRAMDPDDVHEVGGPCGTCKGARVVTGIGAIKKAADVTPSTYSEGAIEALNQWIAERPENRSCLIGNDPLTDISSDIAVVVTETGPDLHARGDGASVAEAIYVALDRIHGQERKP